MVAQLGGELRTGVYGVGGKGLTVRGRVIGRDTGLSVAGRGRLKNHRPENNC